MISEFINMGTETNGKLEVDTRSPDYLSQLLKDKKQIQAFPPNIFSHIERLLDEEINRVRISLFHNKPDKQPLSLPDPLGPVVTLTEKVWVPTEKFPEFNFVGRILGPRGMTLKDLEAQTGCKIMVRGKGSMREKQKEDANRGKASWEHLNENLHVLISVEDTRNRAELKLKSAIAEINKLLVPAEDGDDDIKKNQLMELAIFNGTYRNQRDVIPQVPQHLLQAQRMVAGTGQINMPALRSPAGAPIILAPRFPMPQLSSTLLSGAPPPLISPTDSAALTSGLMFNPYDLSYTTAAFSAGMLEYPPQLDQSAAGALHKVRRTIANTREHPYTRIVTMPTLTQ